MRQIEQDLRDSSRVRELIRVLLSLSDEEELIWRFLRDLLTYEEIVDQANRWAAAIRLADGRTVRQVADELAISPSVVERVRQWLVNGTGGYTEALKRRPSLQGD